VHPHDSKTGTKKKGDEFTKEDPMEEEQLTKGGKLLNGGHIVVVEGLTQFVEGKKEKRAG